MKQRPACLVRSPHRCSEEGERYGEDGTRNTRRTFELDLILGEGKEGRLEGVRVLGFLEGNQAELGGQVMMQELGDHMGEETGTKRMHGLGKR